ncbi:MAG TPA: DoxX family membrane protein [Crocinitomicaceae bacterium]|nr:DoxX family membrane protein [Crocinitomicaceae bacterium]
MKKGLLIIRIILGLMMVVFGLNKFIHFMPMPEMQPAMENFMQSLVSTGYLMALVAVVEIVAGILFLTNKLAAFGAVILVPVLLNAFLAHLFMDPAGIGGAAAALIMNLFLLYGFKEKYQSIFSD